MTEKALILQNISKELAQKPVLQNISFDLHYGEIAALLGPNGAGKSTTLRILSGLIPPTEGTLRIAGKSFHSERKEIKKTIGFLSSEMSLYHTFSVRESLEYLGSLRQIPPPTLRPRIDELIAQFHLDAFCDVKYATLSSGQKQRAHIAATLLHRPSILFLDEITTSMDIVSSRHILDVLKEEAKKGSAVLFSTHILSEAEYLGDRLLLINDGKLIDDTTQGKLLEKHGKPSLLEAFLAALNHPLTVDTHEKQTKKNVGT